MTRGGAHKKIDDPERKCIATGEVQPKLGLIRFVASPDSTVFPDVMEKLPGRQGGFPQLPRKGLQKR